MEKILKKRRKKPRTWASWRIYTAASALKPAPADLPGIWKQLGDLQGRREYRVGSFGAGGQESGGSMTEARK